MSLRRREDSEITKDAFALGYYNVKMGKSEKLFKVKKKPKKQKQDSNPQPGVVIKTKEEVMRQLGIM